MRNQAEFRLSCVVADYLARALPTDALWTHFPAGEARTAITGARLKRMGLHRGWPDYLIFWNRILLGIELKADGGAASPEQRAVGAAMIGQGADWVIVRTIEQLETHLIAHGFPLRATVRLAA